MGKNNKLLNQFALMNRHIHTLTPQIYAALALALHRQCGWGYVRINRLFAESQKIWDECVDKGLNMIQMCEDETGIQVTEKRSN